MRNLHETVLHERTGAQVDVDVVPLVDALMDAGCTTYASCQGGEIAGRKPTGYVAVARGSGERALMSLSRRDDVTFEFDERRDGRVHVVRDDPEAHIWIELRGGGWILRFDHESAITSLVDYLRAEGF